MPEELILGAVPERGPVEDILITETGLSLRQLPEKTRVATGSIRRKSQLLHLRPDLITSDLRGNIDTRLNKLKEQDIDAIIMAKAAIIRLNLGDVKYSSFKIDEMIPAVGQGTIGLQIRKDDLEIQKVLNTINHYNTYQAIVAERELLYTLDSGCQFPVGAFACIEKGRLKIKGFVGSEDGKDVLIESFDSEPENAVFAGQTTAQKLIDRGALSLLKSMY